jgi:LuxR family maltose regulon positive regulatory protein
VSVKAVEVPRTGPNGGREHRRATSTLPFVILESKLTPGIGSRALVPRPALIERLEMSGAVPVVAVVAPPGYGKTALLAQWAERKTRRFAWLSLDERDNDLAVLLAYIAAALDRVERLDPVVLQALASSEPTAIRTVLARLGSALAAMTARLALVLDNVHLLLDRRCLEAVVTLAAHLREGSQLVIAGRAEPPLVLARLRSEGRVLEIGRDDLAMSVQEAGSLLRGVGASVAPAIVERLFRRTEGWPAALHLAARSMERSSAEAVTPIADDRLLVDYLRSVVLSRQGPEEIRFLERTSVLDRLSGPLCDAVLETSGSAAALESLERTNLLVIPLNRGRVWYRYHSLFREVLRAELERREPELARRLMLRAAAWCERNALPEDAGEYTMRAGAADRFAVLVSRLTLPLYHDGRLTTLQRWFAWFDQRGLIERYPAVAILGAWVHTLAGQAAAAERWADVAERGSFPAAPTDGAPVDGWRAILRATLCRDGIERMLTDAELALASLPVGSRWRPTALLLAAIAHLLSGDPARADRLLASAAEAAEDADASDTAAVALSERAILAIGRREWDEAEVMAEQARSFLRRSSLGEYPTSVLLYAVAARVAIHRGDVQHGRDDLARAQRLRPRLTAALPFLAVQARLELASAYLALTDAVGARTVLREADGLLLRRPLLGMLRGQAEELRAQLDKIRADVAGASSLTAAELRVLPLLLSYRSFREIGEELHVSRHTVKSHAMSIYRKFGVTSRSEAIEHARHLGLI